MSLKNILKINFSNKILKLIRKNKKLNNSLNNGININGYYILIQIDINDIKIYKNILEYFINCVKMNDGMFTYNSDKYLGCLFSEELFCIEIRKKLNKLIFEIKNYFEIMNIEYKIGISYGEIIIGKLKKNNGLLAMGKTINRTMYLASSAGKNVINIDDGINKEIFY